ncbi:MAG: UDP-phosphate N-acetylgalactosaminyl-1-phosphate transferase [Sphingobacteriaceae bacterium]|nr:UDP-phosphate N-acetylgalactosaminyl-1-phosphate transferase [Sphingobacteriaceae bacterium]
MDSAFQEFMYGRTIYSCSPFTDFRAYLFMSNISFLSDTTQLNTAPSYHNSIKKRILDVVLCLLSAPLVLPLILLFLPFVWVSDGGPVFFSQIRVGRNGSTFVMYKIRSLKKTFDPKTDRAHTDYDVLAVGRVMRATRMDELPQWWNILKGEMSWVGPRPEVPFYVEHFSEKHPEYRLRELARPGIAGLAQLKNPDALPSHNLEKLIYDLEYVQRANLWLDLKILLRSFVLVFFK